MRIQLGFMSRMLRHVSWTMAWVAAPLVRFVATQRSLVVVLAPAPPGSLGDEVLLRGLLSGLDTDTGSIRFIESSKSRGQGWANELGIGRQGPDLSSRLAGLAHLRLLSRAGEVFVVGADVLDGYYSAERSRRRIQFARLAARLGSGVSIVSYSLNESPVETVIAEWRRLPANVRLVARDSRSAARTAQLVGRRAVLGADLGFLAASSPQSDVASMVRGSLCLVPNVGLSAQYGGYPNLVDSLTVAVRALLESPSVASVTLMPHDSRGADSAAGDFALCTAVVERLEGSAGRLSMRVPADALHARTILGSAQVVLTARMHAAIGALCESRPILLLGYQGKAEGLLEAFDLSGHLLSPEVFADTKNLVRSVECAFARANELQAQISDKLPAQIQRAKLNLVGTDGSSLAKRLPK